MRLPITPARPADPDAPVLGYSVPAARKALGNISHSFFYKLAAQGRVKITKIGRRSIVTPANLAACVGALRERDATEIAVPKKPVLSRSSQSPSEQKRRSRAWRSHARTAGSRSLPHPALLGEPMSIKRNRRPGAEPHPEAAAKPILRIVIFKNKHGERLSKKFSLVGDKLEKQSATFLSRGTYDTAHLPLTRVQRRRWTVSVNCSKGLDPTKLSPSDVTSRVTRAEPSRASASRARAISPGR